MRQGRSSLADRALSGSEPDRLFPGVLGPPVLALALLASPAPLAAQAPLALMPLPARMQPAEGRLRLDSTFTAVAAPYADARLRRGITRALERLRHRIAQPLAVAAEAGPAGPATLAVAVDGPGERVQSPAEEESYTIAVTPAGARLAAPTVVGALHGLETLLQLVSADSAGFYLPVVRIADQPRFRWRGLLIDAGRHWMPPDMIRRTLDGMAAVKLNVLHWHLSDDQGFRVESLRYPRLQRLGSEGMYYTQEEIRALVAYARDRGIRVVPEFDMPGHATSWFVAYPEYASLPGPYEIEWRFGVFTPTFDPTREATYRFIEGFISEMAALFPDRYWHIGGDEVSGNQWNQNPRILRFKREHGFRNNDALQAWFDRRLAKILGRHGKRMAGWDEILHDSLPAGTMIQSWRGTEFVGRAAARGYSAILSAPYYLDHMDSADKMYLADPLPAGAGLSAEQADHVLGGEACMWAEQVSEETVDSRIWPRLAAIAERFWSPAEVRDVDDMYRRLSSVSVELEGVGLGHEAHTYRMLRLLTGRRGIQPLHDLLAVTMPVTFGQRAGIQATTRLTPLTRLVDAARPDPWARSQMNRLASAVTRDPAGSETQRDQLRRIFSGWRPLAAQVASLADSIPLARDGEAAAAALALLGDIGLQGLDYGVAGGAPPAWRDSTLARLDELAKPQGLLRLAGVEAVRTLVEGLK